MENFNNVNSLFRYIASNRLNKGDVVVDATAGNGNDILFMMKLVGSEGFGYGFDIQKTAIENTEKRIEEAGFSDSVKVINDGHENADIYIDREIDFAVFNLGYLPKADHNVITKSETTVTAIEKLMKLLKKNGCIVIAAYVGHPGGMEEYGKVKEFAEDINQKEFNVFNLEFINQRNNPPKLIVIEKRR